MCQFSWWGSPCTGQSTGGGPYLFFRSPEPLPGEPILSLLAGLYRTRNSHLAGNRTAVYTVALNSDPVGTVTVKVTSEDTGAATVSADALTFSGGSGGNWSTAQAVTVTAVDDAIY